MCLPGVQAPTPAIDAVDVSLSALYGLLKTSGSEFGSPKCSTLNLAILRCMQLFLPPLCIALHGELSDMPNIMCLLNAPCPVIAEFRMWSSSLISFSSLQYRLVFSVWSASRACLHSIRFV